MDNYDKALESVDSMKYYGNDQTRDYLVRGLIYAVLSATDAIKDVADAINNKSTTES